MTKKRLYALLSEVSQREMESTTPKAASYWKRHWKRLYNLAKSLGWEI